MDNEAPQEFMDNEIPQEYMTPEENRARNQALVGLLQLPRFMDEGTQAHLMGQTQLMGFQYHHFEGPQAAAESQQFHECPKCHMTFTRLANLRRHVRRLHEADADTPYYRYFTPLFAIT